MWAPDWWCKWHGMISLSGNINRYICTIYFRMMDKIDTFMAIQYCWIWARELSPFHRFFPSSSSSSYRFFCILTGKQPKCCFSFMSVCLYCMYYRKTTVNNHGSGRVFRSYIRVSLNSRRDLRRFSAKSIQIMIRTEG